MAAKSGKVTRGVRVVMEVKGAPKVEKALNKTTAGLKKTGAEAKTAAKSLSAAGAASDATGKSMADALDPIDKSFAGMDKLNSILGKVAMVGGLVGVAVGALTAGFAILSNALATATGETERAVIAAKELEAAQRAGSAATGVLAAALAGMGDSIDPEQILLRRTALLDLADAEKALTSAVYAQAEGESLLAQRQERLLALNKQRHQTNNVAEHQRLTAEISDQGDKIRSATADLERYESALAQTAATLGGQRAATRHVTEAGEGAIAKPEPPTVPLTPRTPAPREHEISAVALAEQLLGEIDGQSLADALGLSVVPPQVDAVTETIASQSAALDEQARALAAATSHAISYSQASDEMGDSAGRAAGEILAASILQGEGIKAQVAALLEAKSTEYIIEAGAATAKGIIAGVTGNGAAAAGFFTAAGIYTAMAGAASLGAGVLGGGGGGGGGGAAAASTGPDVSSAPRDTESGSGATTITYNVTGMVYGSLEQMEAGVARGVGRAYSRDDGPTNRAAIQGRGAMNFRR